MSEYLKALGVELVAAEARLKLATARGAWKDAVKAAERAVEIEAEMAEARAVPAKTNIVGRPKVHG
jgi:hypothetical protein